MTSPGERNRLGAGRLENLHARMAVLTATRAFFAEREFLEVETPVVVPSPGLDVHLDAFEVAGAVAPRYLNTSPEYQMKRLLAAGPERIYQVTKAFRRDEVGHLHNPEFTLLEWYRTHAGSHEMMRDTEQLVSQVVTGLRGTPHVDGVQGAIDLSPPWPRITVEAAFARYAGTPLASVLPDEDRFFRLLIERIEPELGRGQPTFLTHYPASMASLSRLHPDDPRWADRFEAYVDGIELCNGFGELVDPDEQRARLLRDQENRGAGNKPVYPIDERFLAALAEGVPESGGNALGLDRLVMLAVGSRDIREVLAFAADEL